MSHVRSPRGGCGRSRSRVSPGGWYPVERDKRLQRAVGGFRAECKAQPQGQEETSLDGEGSGSPGAPQHGSKRRAGPYRRVTPRHRRGTAPRRSAAPRSGGGRQGRGGGSPGPPPGRGCRAAAAERGSGCGLRRAGLRRAPRGAAPA